MPISSSLGALLSGVIDYAGLFPPASLTLDESIRNYARYRTSPDSWMLGRFICPSAKLAELTPFVKELFSRSDRLPIVLLGRGGQDVRQGLKEDLAALDEFDRQVGERVSVDVFETRITRPGPVEINRPFKTFLEVTLDRRWRETIRATLDALPEGAGFKLRTGGVEASAFPPVPQVAFAIAECRDRDIPLKFTAGLHHPIRHSNKSVNAKMHGFVNVFVAGVLARTGGLNEVELGEILEDEDPSNFKFEREGLSWRDLRADLAHVEAARRDGVITFGSCSFDEPRDDLRVLGWL
jgi:hypothetical protein